MWNQFFLERYADEKHEAHLREADLDRLPNGVRQSKREHPRRRARLNVALATAGVLVGFATAIKLVPLPT
jgi:hypothetical protein